MRANFASRRLVSKKEEQVMLAIEMIVQELKLPWRVFAQVSLGEILLSADDDAYSTINAKRVDLLLVDQHMQPVSAVEYQGNGHFQGSAAARDAIKREALRRAGIGFIEVHAG